jgi:hypothetical protein
MPLPSEATVQGAIGKACIMDLELSNYLSVTGTHWVTREAAFLAAVPADSMPEAQNGQRQQRAALDGATKMLAIRCGALWVTYARVLLLAPGDSIFERLYRYFGDNSSKVLSRGFSFGAVAAGGSNVGTGTIRRLTVDMYNFVIESGFAEVKTIECIRDSNNGVPRHSEVFSLRGKPVGRDNLERIGTGFLGTVEAMSCASTIRAGVQNPSFDSLATTTFSAVTDVQGWTMSAFASFETSTAEYYRDTPGVTTNRSLRFLANGTLKQTFAAMRFNWDPNVPIYAQVNFKREGACDGNLKIKIGSVTSTVALVAQSGWTIHTFVITTNAWMKNWDAVGSDPTTNGITLEWSDRTGGTLYIDDFLLGPYQNLDGAWIAAVGAATPFVLRDVFTFTDTSTDTGIVQTQLAKAYHFYLPHASSGNTWTEPT